MGTAEVVSRLRSMADPRSVEGMARYGISTGNALGISVTNLRKVAKEIGRDHRMALELWATGIHEARILAAIIDEPGKVSRRQMDRWAKDFDSWDVCDQACTCLFDRTPHAIDKAVEWSRREEEFVKRAGFALIAGLAAHDKAAPDEVFAGFLEHVKRESDDDRKYVRKAVNWALRQIGKRNVRLNGLAISCAEDIATVDSRAARWIASDALRELRSEAVQRRLAAKRPGARPARYRKS
ncbi:MAG: DNA alkylation repair protein [Methanobacteriota archaeon]|nr:MAG: DNA alkylation repair protein [Euryarchaeota archaeon]